MAGKWFPVWCEACGEASEVLGKDTILYHGKCKRRGTTSKFKNTPPQFKRTPPLEDFAHATGR